MSPKTDLIARLEAEKHEATYAKITANASYYTERNFESLADTCRSASLRFANLADTCRSASLRFANLAADLRAAAAAVRLVAECREALKAIRNEVSAGCHPDAPVEELKTGIHYEPVLMVDTVIEKIAEWEGKHGQ